MLRGKVAVITGGTRGIGFETVKTFCENHAKVILFGSRKETVEKAIASLKEEGMEAEGYHPNLSNYEEVEALIRQIKDSYGRIDILVNNAGISQKEPIEALSSEDFQKIMNLNVNGMFHTSKAVVPIMKEQMEGVILNTSSMVSRYGQPSGIGYPTVNGFTLSLARELAAYHIRVNAVAPGITKTDMVAALPEEMIAPLIQTIPLGRIGEPRDIANAFLFLASDLASYISGVVLPVDGLARS